MPPLFARCPHPDRARGAALGRAEQERPTGPSCRAAVAAPRRLQPSAFGAARPAPVRILHQPRLVLSDGEVAGHLAVRAPASAQEVHPRLVVDAAHLVLVANHWQVTEAHVLPIFTDLPPSGWQG